MRISMVSEHASPLAPLGSVDAGGQNVHVDKLAAGLSARGHHVTVFTRRDDPDLSEVVTMASGARVVHVSTGEDRFVPKDQLLEHMPAMGRGIADFWRTHSEARPDVVHSHFWMSALAARTALEDPAAAGAPLVHTFHALGTVKRRHQGAADTSPSERIALETSIGRAAQRIVSTCPDERDELTAMGIDATTVDVIPCGVDTEQFTPGPGPAAPATILCLGRLVPRKGFDLVIRGLAELSDRGLSDIVVDIVGGSADGGAFAADPEVRRLHDLAVDLGVSDRVRLRGHLDRDEIPAAIRRASIVACTPWYEPFGIVPLEAMASGVPVIATAVGGLQDTVVDGGTGLLIPPDDAPAFAAAAERILTAPDTARALGRAGVERVRADYTWTSVAARTEASYLRALAAVRPKAFRGQTVPAGSVATPPVTASPARTDEPGQPPPSVPDVLEEQLRGVSVAVASLGAQLETLRQWSGVLARSLAAGGTLFCAGNGGSAAEAQHLSAELVGRFAGDRPAFSAIALTTDSSAVTAIGNDYGFDHVFARQIEAHARPGDILVLLSTSGRSPNLVHAAEAANRIGATTWALTGPGQTPLTAVCDDAIRIEATPSHVQEAHLIAVHCLCTAFDAHISAAATAPMTAIAPASTTAAAAPPLVPPPAHAAPVGLRGERA